MNNNELISIIESWEQKHNDDIIVRLERLERQNREIGSKQARILDKITLINGKLSTLLEECVNIQLIAKRIDLTGLPYADIINSNKAWQEGFNAAMTIKNFEQGKEAAKEIYELSKKHFYDGGC